MENTQLAIVLKAIDESKAVLVAAQKNIENLGKAADETAKKTSGIDKFSASFKSLTGVSLGAAAVVGAITGAFISTVQAAGSAEAEMSRFNTTMRNSGDASGKASEAILKQADAVTKLGFDDEEAANSMADFYARTKDVTAATKLNNLAMDVARAKNISLAEASGMIKMVLSGNSKALKQYGIELKEGQKPMQALKEMQDKTANSAESFAKTYQGQMEVMKTAWGNFKEGIGGIFLPAINAVLRGLSMGINSMIDFGSAISAVSSNAWSGMKQGVSTFAEVGNSMGSFFSTGKFGAVDWAASSKNAHQEVMASLNAAKASHVDMNRVQIEGTEAVKGFTGAQAGSGSAMGEAKKKAEELRDNIQKMRDAYRDTVSGVRESLAKLRDDHRKFLGEIDEKIKNTKEEIAKLEAAYGGEKADNAKTAAEAIIKQEQRIADLTTQIKEEQAKENPDNKKIEELQALLSKEQAAKKANADAIMKLDAEVVEARRVAGLTDLERALEEHHQKQEAAKKEYDDKKALLDQELINYQNQKVQEEVIYRAQQDRFKKIIKETYVLHTQTMADQTKATDDFVKSAVRNYKELEDAARRASEAISKVQGGSSATTKTGAIQARASGGPVSSGRPYLVGENGPEIFNPNSNGSIIPNGGNSGGGITIIVQGNTLLDRDAGEKIANMVVRELAFNTQF